MKFKKGDKVRLKDPKQFRFGAITLTIMRVPDNYHFLYVSYQGIHKRGYNYFPLKPCEIKYVVTKGQQLLFEFMGE